MDMIDIETESRLEENQRRIRAAQSASSNGRIDYSGLGLQAPPIKIVAGNKCDLKDARVISSRQGLEYARKRGCGFMETSAREMVNIEESFALIVRRVVEARKLLTRETIESSSPPSSQTARAQGSRQQESSHNQQNTSISRTAPLSPLQEKFESGRGRGDGGGGGSGWDRKRPWWKRLFFCCF